MLIWDLLARSALTSHNYKMRKKLVLVNGSPKHYAVPMDQNILQSKPNLKENKHKIKKKIFTNKI